VRAQLCLLAEARAVSGLPVIAIGGITARNAARRSLPAPTWSR
jgi:thiamine monophosphate synthase